TVLLRAGRGVDEIPKRTPLDLLDFPMIADGCGIFGAQLVIKREMIKHPIRHKPKQIVGVVPIHAHLDPFVLEAGRVGDARHWSHDVIQIAMVVDELERSLFVELFAVYSVGELTRGDDFGAGKATMYIRV